MRTKKQRVQESGKSEEQSGWMPPGKEKAPKPNPAAVTDEPEKEQTAVKPEERKTDDQVIAPDGKPESKKEPEPLF